MRGRIQATAVKPPPLEPEHKSNKKVEEQHCGGSIALTRNGSTAQPILTARRKERQKPNHCHGRLILNLSSLIALLLREPEKSMEVLVITYSIALACCQSTINMSCPTSL